MKLTMLGTGCASAIECYNTCFLISNESEHLLVDTGGGNYILKVLKDIKIPIENIHDIFITHKHIDHLLGLIWIIRIIGQKMEQGKYEGSLRIYSYRGLEEIITSIVEMTMQKSTVKLLGDRIVFIPVDNGETREIIGCNFTFFDIGSMKTTEYGFTMITPDGKKVSCCGDEPYNAIAEKYVKGSDWLMHEAYCLPDEADIFKPYDKKHCTVKEACQNAELLEASNLIIYHTEDMNLPVRKELYIREGSKYYRGNIFVPDDKETIEL